jgi:hypothetical protein
VKLGLREPASEIFPVVGNSGVVDVGLGRVALLLIVVVAVLNGDGRASFASLVVGGPIVVTIVVGIIVAVAVVDIVSRSSATIVGGFSAAMLAAISSLMTLA